MKELYIDGIPTSSLNFRPESRPSSFAATPRYSVADEVIGTDGNLYESEETFDDIKETIKFSMLATNEMNFHDTFRQIKRFLLKGGERKYETEDNPHYFRKIKQITIKTPERKAYTAGVFECEFVFDPYEYRNDGQTEHTISECLFNPYSKCYPLYKINGYGACELVVNGHAIRLNVNGHAYIDSSLRIAYRDYQQNQPFSGCELRGLALIEDMNEIRITNGFDLKIVPNWRSI